MGCMVRRPVVAHPPRRTRRQPPLNRTRTILDRGDGVGDAVRHRPARPAFRAGLRPGRFPCRRSSGCRTNHTGGGFEARGDGRRRGPPEGSHLDAIPQRGTRHEGLLAQRGSDQQRQQEQREPPGTCPDIDNNWGSEGASRADSSPSRWRRAGSPDRQCWQGIVRLAEGMLSGGGPEERRPGCGSLQHRHQPDHQVGSPGEWRPRGTANST